jgi:hypothetical protein
VNDRNIVQPYHFIELGELFIAKILMDNYWRIFFYYWFERMAKDMMALVFRKE